MGNTLMLVEDHAIFRCALKEMLQRWFPTISIVEAGDVPDALRFAAEQAPDVILMDIHLPSGSGLDATRLIKGDLPDTTVIVCSSESCTAYRRAAFASGASHFIPKTELFTSNIQSVIETAFASARRLSPKVDQ